MLRIDTHQHLWNLDKVAYPWLIPDFGPIYRTFEASELEPQLKAANIDKTVMVQSMNSYADTDAMLENATNYEWICGVVGWVPIHDPVEAARKLEEYTANPYFKGVRHLIHDESNPNWVVQKQVFEGLKLLADNNLTFDVVAVFPNHLKHVPSLAEKVPNLKIVIDHLAKPPLDPEQKQIWKEQLKAAAESPNVFAKLSGLNTTVPDFNNWTYEDIKPAIDYALEVFGAERLMFGGDWPVAILAGNYEMVVAETEKAIADLSDTEKEAIWQNTANGFYNLGL